MTEYMYILEEIHPLLITRPLFPRLVLRAEKEWFVLSTQPRRIGVLRFRDASNTFLQQSELDKHASQSPPGNPEKKKEKER